MKCTLICFLLIIILLSSCKAQDDNGDKYSCDDEKITIEATSEDETINEDLTNETIDGSIVTNPTQTSLFPAKIVDENIISFLKIDNPRFRYDYYPSELVMGVFGDYVLWISQEFINLVGYNDYESWEIYEKFDGDLEKLWSYRTDLSEFINLYSFICEFNLSEQQIRTALIEWNERGTVEMDEKHVYSEEEIVALATKNKNEITRLFATSLAVVKNDKIYVPGWFFFASFEEYKSANITSSDLITVLGNCRNHKYYKSEVRFGENVFSHLYLLDLIEYKAYNYLDGDIDVVELCGYDRDFDMPMAYDGYYESVLQREDGYERYACFYNPCGEYNYDIAKSENSYSPHWVYYNKPEAYRGAGITPDELMAMLPLYKSLGIMSDEAITALERKLEAYAGEYDET